MSNSKEAARIDRASLLDSRQSALMSVATTSVVISVCAFAAYLVVGAGVVAMILWIGAAAFIVLGVVALLCSIWARTNRDQLLRQRRHGSRV